MNSQVTGKAKESIHQHSHKRELHLRNYTGNVNKILQPLAGMYKFIKLQYLEITTSNPLNKYLKILHTLVNICYILVSDRKKIFNKNYDLFFKLFTALCIVKYNFRILYCILKSILTKICNAGKSYTHIIIAQSP